MSRWVGLLILLFLFASRAWAEDAVVVAASADHVEVTSRWRYLRDQDGSLTPEMVWKALEAEPGSWSSLAPGETNLGHLEGAVWIHMRARSEGEGNRHFVLDFAFSRFNRLDVWEWPQGSSVVHWVSGVEIPFAQWPLDHHAPAFPLELPQGRQVDVLVRMKSVTPLILTSSLFSADEFQSHQSWEQMALAAFAVGMLCLVVVGLLVFLAFSRWSALLLLSQMFFTTFYAASVELWDFKFLWPAFPRLALASKDILGALAIISLGLLLLKTFAIADGWRRHLLLWSNGAVFCVIPASLVWNSVALDSLEGAMGAASCIIHFAVMVSLVSRKVQAKFFVAGYAAFLFLNVLHIMQVFGVLRGGDHTLVLPYVAGGSLSLMLLLGFMGEIVSMNRSLALSNERLSELNGSLVSEIATRARYSSELAAERRRSLEKARTTALGEMSRNVVHEINTPLSILSFKIENMERELRGATPDMRAVRSILSSMSEVVGRVNALVNSLRLLGREGKSELPMEFRLEETLQSVVAVFGERAQEAGAVLRFRRDEVGGTLVVGRQAASLQVLSHLVANAVEAHLVANVPGERYIEVFTRWEDGGEVCVIVEDNACGVPPEFEGSIFEPFFTTKAGLSGRGLGLGLARNMAREDGGDIVLESPRAPTRFVWRIPVEKIKRAQPA